MSVQFHALGSATPAHLERARRAMLRILLAGLAPKGAPVPPLPLELVPSRGASKAGRPPPKARSGGKGQRRKK